MSETTPDIHGEAARHAEELTEMAAEKDDPGARAFLLEWAKAFRRLANLGAFQAHQRPANISS